MMFLTTLQQSQEFKVEARLQFVRRSAMALVYGISDTKPLKAVVVAAGGLRPTKF